VCTVVGVRLMTCVPHAGHSAELWRLCTSTHVWERADSTVTNGTVPSARFSHVMTSVGQDLWVHGGYTLTGGSTEMWWFSTSTRVWERADSTAVDGAGPSASTGHVMTSVGVDLWVHGGQTDYSGEGDSCATHVALLLLSH
jgi:hypothetical protein